MKPHELITLKLRSGNYGTLKQELHLDAAEEIDRKAAQLAGAHHDAAAALALVADLDAANVELAKARETIRQLRAHLDEYERAPTIAKVVFVEKWVEREITRCVTSQNIPPIGTELIARPARKGE